MRIVLDTNILVRANPLASPTGLARELVVAAATAPHVLLVSLPILREVRRVLSYPRVQARWPLSAREISDYLHYLELSGVMVEGLPDPMPQIVSDPDDNPILQTAVAGRADVLCSRDTAFGDSVVTRFCASRGIRLIDDVGLMAELRNFSEI